jgi:putative acetyltransferase
VIIRPERPEDFEAIDDVVAQAFGRDDEARLVRDIRASDNYVPELALVAEDQEIVGHIMLSYVELSGKSVLSLAPLAVRPGRQRDGIGAALTEAALELADKNQEPLVVVLGHPSYYPRFGFEPARALGIEPHMDDVPDDAWMVKRLRAYDPAIRGRVVYPPAFDVTT